MRPDSPLAESDGLPSRVRGERRRDREIAQRVRGRGATLRTADTAIHNPPRLREPRCSPLSGPRVQAECRCAHALATERAAGHRLTATQTSPGCFVGVGRYRGLLVGRAPLRHRPEPASSSTSSQPPRTRVPRARRGCSWRLPCGIGRNRGQGDVPPHPCSADDSGRSRADATTSGFFLSPARVAEWRRSETSR